MRMAGTGTIQATLRFLAAKSLIAVLSSTGTTRESRPVLVRISEACLRKHHRDPLTKQSFNAFLLLQIYYNGTMKLVGSWVAQCGDPHDRPFAFLTSVLLKAGPDSSLFFIHDFKLVDRIDFEEIPLFAP